MSLKLALKIRKETNAGWVRAYRDGSICAGPEIRTIKERDALAERIRAAGYVAKCIGKPGTAGEFIIDIAENKSWVVSQFENN